MKTSLTTLISATLLLLTGCSQQTSAPKNNMVAQQDEINSPHTFMLRGTVIIGHESQSIQPCNSDQQYWVNLSPRQWKAGTDIQSRPYQAMYGEFIGHFEAPPKGGFSSDYPARFVVSHINRLVAGEGPSCAQPPQPTKAFGNEPFWNMQVKSGELVFSQMGNKTKKQLITKQEFTPTRREYHSENFSLIMTKGLCNDSMVESIYGWNSEVTVNDTTYKGCGTLAPKDTTLNWVGTYQGTSTLTTPGLNIHLVLNPDHSAITTYDNQTGEDPLVETGVWQATRDDHVHVLMSRHQRQYLIAERTFTKKGKQIHTDKETVNGVTFPIKSGLTLFSTSQ
ncbi:hypothetical protein [Aliivibrio fischeri]|uniref:hypothetical protein n=1 Tax=Aliivibrio fischeri TaxID=668 RepID=UPI0012DA5F07|nr:hypothetical protein [Aliivibrio fischeri]MUJ37352.1 hypothetical protein [Aliivibrio fischeri]